MVWPWKQGQGSFMLPPSKLIISCDCPADHFRKSASKSVKTISKYCVKKFDMVGRKEEGTRWKHYISGQCWVAVICSQQRHKNWVESSELNINYNKKLVLKQHYYTVLIKIKTLRCDLERWKCWAWLVGWEIVSCGSRLTLDMWSCKIL